MKKIFMTMAAMAMVAVMASCGGNAGNKCEQNCDSTKCEQKAACDSSACAENKCGEATAEAATSEASTEAVDLSKKYVCPARCESSDEPGQCSKCGMDLEEGNN